MADLVRQFGIDWKLLLAQAVNFAVLFFILYRFAYHPILSMLQERRKRIKEGERMRDEAELKLASAGQERETILKKTERESTELLARTEVSAKAREETIIAEGQKKRRELEEEGKRRAEEARRIMAEEFSREAEGLLRDAIAKFAEKSPAAIDTRLVREALTETGNVRAKA